MKLQEFVSETLKEIVAGVKQAQEYARDNNAAINPWAGLTGTNCQSIDFDVAVTSTDTSETQAGAGVFVAALGLGVKDKLDTLSSCISRVKFSVPLVLPLHRPK